MNTLVLFFWTAAFGAMYVYGLLQTHFLISPLMTILPGRDRIGHSRTGCQRYIRTSTGLKVTSPDGLWIQGDRRSNIISSIWFYYA